MRCRDIAIASVLAVGLLLPSAVLAGQQREGGQGVDRFGQRDANKDGKLTPEEFGNRDLFPQVDADKDGVITRAEATAFFRGGRGRQQQQARPPAVPPTHADIRYGPHERNVLDLYLADSDEPTPLLVFIHGGGFTGGDKRNVRPELVREMHRNGISVAAIHYRFITTDPMPASYHDSARALQFLRHHAADYNLDPERFAVTGGSAGAGTSLWLAFHDDLADPDAEDPIARESTRVLCAQVGAAQVSYDPRFWRKIGLARGLEHPSFAKMYGRKEGEPADAPRLTALYEECAPITHVTADDPPVYMTYGIGLEVGPGVSMGDLVHHPLQGVTLKKKLDPLGIDCTVVYKDGPEPPMSGNEFLVEHLTE